MARNALAPRSEARGTVQMRPAGDAGHDAIAVVIIPRCFLRVPAPAASSESLPPLQFTWDPSYPPRYASPRSAIELWPVWALPAMAVPVAPSGAGVATVTTPPITQELLNAALAYAARGWYVIPLHDVTQGHCSCGIPQCDAPSKHPRIHDWISTASIDPTQIPTLVDAVATRQCWHPDRGTLRPGGPRR